MCVTKSCHRPCGATEYTVATPINDGFILWLPPPRGGGIVGGGAGSGAKTTGLGGPGSGKVLGGAGTGGAANNFGGFGGNGSGGGGSVTDGFYVPSASQQPLWQALTVGGIGGLGKATGATSTTRT